MQKFILLFSIIILVSCGSQRYTMQVKQPDQLGASQQLVIVTSKNWRSSAGEMILFEKKNDTWQRLEGQMEVSLGKNGMIPGNGILSFDSGQMKQEGDEKTPAGIFPISLVFGTTPVEDVHFVRFPYILAHQDLLVVNDPDSKYYNRIISINDTPDKDWNSAIGLLRSDHLYDWSIVIDYNRNPVVKGAGSAIYIHLWKERGHPTAGCMAISEENMMKLLNWLDPQKKPLVVQFPEKEYLKLAGELGLPLNIQ